MSFDRKMNSFTYLFIIVWSRSSSTLQRQFSTSKTVSATRSNWHWTDSDVGNIFPFISGFNEVQVEDEIKVSLLLKVHQWRVPMQGNSDQCLEEDWRYLFSFLFQWRRNDNLRLVGIRCCFRLRISQFLGALSKKRSSWSWGDESSN